MEKALYFKQLTDAIDLLSMLEQLSRRLGAETRSDDSSPWAGVGLTVSRSRELVLAAYQQLQRESLVSAGGELSPSAFIPKTAAAAAGGFAADPNSGSDEGLSVSPLAGRVQRVPSRVGRVRELISGAAAPQTVENHDEEQAMAGSPVGKGSAEV